VHTNGENLSYEAAVFRLFMQNKIDRYTLFECTRVLALYEHELIQSFAEGSNPEALAFSGLYKTIWHPGYIETDSCGWDDDAFFEEMSGVKFVKGSSLEFRVNAIGEALRLALQ